MVYEVEDNDRVSEAIFLTRIDKRKLRGAALPLGPVESYKRERGRNAAARFAKRKKNRSQLKTSLYADKAQ
jgi:hypothetical protein